MKVEPIGHGGLDIIPENDAERVWLSNFVGGFEEEMRPILSNYIQVDLESMCVDEGGSPMEERDIEEVVLDGEDEAWGLVEKLSLRCFGQYIPREMDKRIEKFIKKRSKQVV